MVYDYKYPLRSLKELAKHITIKGVKKQSLLNLHSS